MYKDGGFQMRAKAEHHLNAMVAWTEYKRGNENNTSLLQEMDKQYKKRWRKTKYIKTIADVLLCTATQNIAQHGQRESEGSDNKGNFLAILELIAKHDPLVKQKMGHSNAKYTSHNIQNEILEVLAEMVRKDIVEEVKQSWAFSILVDETKDLKKQEQISLVLRYYYRGTVHESFMHFEHADKLDAAGLTEKIVNSLQKYGLENREQLVWQGYDGASRLPAVLHVLRDIDDENNGDRCVEAQGLSGQIDLNFTGLLVIFRRILGDTKFLSDMLQSPSLYLARAVDLIEALQDTFEQYRDVLFFGELWTEILDIAQRCNM
ncbi:uncharacterized protein V6R79_017566 [Siganus canaliculatus]